VKNFLSNLRCAAWSFRKEPAFAWAVILTLGLGIGIGTAVFSIYNAVVLRPLPYLNPEKLVLVWENNKAKDSLRAWSSVPDYYDWTEQSTRFSKLAGYRIWEGSVVAGGQSPQHVDGAKVTHNFFSLFGVRLAAGRGFLPEEDRPGGTPVAVVSYNFWQHGLGGEKDVTDRSITVDGVVHRIVGVLPADFASPAGAKESVWLPLQGNPAAEDRRVHNVIVFGRLSEGTSLERAQQEMAMIMARLEKQYPEANTGRGAFVEDLYESVVGDVRRPLIILLSSVGLVLLIASVNVGNLFLVRTLSRQREGAVRSALGAGVYQLLQPLLFEAGLLVVLGSAFGLLLAQLGIALFRAVDPGVLPRLEDLRIDGMVVGFNLLAALLAISVTLILSVRRATRSDLQVLLKSGSKTTAGAERLHLRRTLVAVEVALSVMLVIAAGLVIKSYHRISQVDLGFKPQGLVALDLVLPEVRYPFPDFVKEYPNWPKLLPFYNGVLEKVKNLPGVEQVILAANHPLSPGFPTDVTFDDREAPGPGEKVRAQLRPVGPGYFQVVRIALLKGRAFTPEDRVDRPMVIIVNESFARKFYGGVDAALGKRISFWGKSREIVGVVHDERFKGVKEPMSEAMYPPFLQCPLPNVSIVARTSVSPDSLTQELQKAVWSVDPDLAINSVRPMTELLSEQLARPRFDMLFFIIFAVLALILAMVGVYGVMAQIVAQRTSEVAIRMALGSRKSSIYGLILKEGTIVVFIGLLLGAALALVLTRIVSSLLFEVNARDPLVFVVSMLLLLATGVAACIIPCRRAMRVEPNTALRYE
jgi:putative ABC transport system permease protein